MDWFGEFPPWLTFSLTFILLALVIAVMALRASRTSLPRRVISNIADITAITYLILNTGEAGAPLFVLYLWVTLGNGFRFGLRAMVFSAVLSFAGFSFVLLVSDNWGGHKMFGVGVMAALVVLPGYAAHLIRQLHLARERAEEASAAKSRFLARMSHELRTPLNGILGTTDLLRNNRRLTNEDRDLLGVIQDSVAVSLRQIDSVLDYAKLEAGKLVIDSADFDLHELINASVRMVRPSVRDKNLYLLMKISPDVPYRLVGDPHHLREIILNLLSNAVKFTESGYVLIEINRTSAHDQMVTLRFEIRDTGIGISPEALERVWESFSQEETGTTRRFGGTGLGTTIAKQLVELMGGRIDVASLKGRGTVFWFEVPFQLQTAAVDVRDGVAGTRVLLVSNNITSINHMGKCIDNIGGNLVIASSLQEAVSSLGRGIRLNNPWHLIFVDDRLAVTSDNFHLAGELSKKAGVMHAPVYLLSDIQ
jgi:two-component system sensor histidine kinase RpfC